MKTKTSFLINKNKINFVQTLMCGQIFSYKKTETGFLIFSANKKAEMIECEKNYKIITNDCNYFENFFDLETNYDAIKLELGKEKILEGPINFGGGIRILKQDLLEVIISFVISANNNIKRITDILFRMREKFGENMGDFFAFPTLENLANITEQDFRELGAGYRSPQLFKLIKQLQNANFQDWKDLKTDLLRSKLIELSGIGPKVADCILLFGYGKTDVFPVDTWIEKVYNHYYGASKNRVLIRKELTEKFKNLSGYAQQYLFYYQRSFEEK